jgi:hypothetical protein
MAFVGETARIQALITFATSSTEPLSRFFRKSFPMVRAARVPTAAEGKGVNFVVFLRASKYRKKRFHCFRLSSDGQRESLLPQRIQSPPHPAEPFHRIKRPPVGKPVLAGYLVAVSGSGVSGGLEAFISREHHANPRGTPERLGWRAVLPELDGNNRLRFR